MGRKDYNGYQRSQRLRYPSVFWQPGTPLSEADQQLLEPVRLRPQELGYSPRREEITGSMKARIRERFRIWSDVLLAAGLPSLNDPEQQRLRRLARQRRSEAASSEQNAIGDTPRQQPETNAAPPIWKKGMPLSESDAWLLQLILKKADELGRTPAARDCPSRKRICRRFGTWSKAIEACGLPPLSDPEQTRLREAEINARKQAQETALIRRRRTLDNPEYHFWRPGDPLTWKDRQLLDRVIEKARELKRSPTRKEAGTNALRKRFRLWEDVLLAAGLPSLKKKKAPGQRKLPENIGMGKPGETEKQT